MDDPSGPAPNRQQAILAAAGRLRGLRLKFAALRDQIDFAEGHRQKLIGQARSLHEEIEAARDALCKAASDG